jgi:hypothetical protein
MLGPMANLSDIKCAPPLLHSFYAVQRTQPLCRLQAGVFSLPRFGTDRARLPQRHFEHNQLYLQELVVDGRQPGKRGPLGIATHSRRDPFRPGRFARDIQFRAAFPTLCP